MSFKDDSVSCGTSTWAVQPRVACRNPKRTLPSTEARRKGLRAAQLPHVTFQKRPRESRWKCRGLRGSGQGEERRASEAQGILGASNSSA